MQTSVVDFLIFLEFIFNQELEEEKRTLISCECRDPQSKKGKWDPNICSGDKESLSYWSLRFC